MLLNEKLIIRELRNGNTQAFVLLYDAYHVRLFNFCVKIIKDKEESKDLVQEVFIKIWETRESLDEDKSFSGFVFKIAKNKVLNRIKKKLSHRIYLVCISEDKKLGTDFNDEVESHEFMGFLKKTIEQLPETTKNIFLLNRNEGLTYKKIAQKLDITENVVDHEIRKALQHIKDQIKKYYPG